MTLDELMTGVQGVGRGVTAGLTDYPAAALNMAVNGGDYKDSLKDIRTNNERMAQENPYSWNGGNVIGGLTQAGLTGGAGLARMVGTGAATGAVSGFTENDDVMEALKGAGLGAALGGAGRGLERIRAYAVKKGLVNTFENTIKDAKALRDKLIFERPVYQEAVKAAQANRGSAIGLAAREKAKNELRQASTALAEHNEKIGGAFGNITQTQGKLAALKTASPDDVLKSAYGSSITAPAPLLNRAFKEGTSNNGFQTAGLGALMGAGGALATGHDPIHGALIGGLGGNMVAPIVRGKLGLIGKVPAKAMGMTANATTHLLTGQGDGRTQAPAAQNLPVQTSQDGPWSEDGDFGVQRPSALTTQEVVDPASGTTSSTGNTQKQNSKAGGAKVENAPWDD